MNGNERVGVDSRSLPMKDADGRVQSLSDQWWRRLERKRAFYWGVEGGCNLWKNAQFAGEDGDILEFCTLPFDELFTIGHKTVEQVIDNVGLEDLDAERVGHFLSISFDFDVERQDDGESIVQQQKKRFVTLQLW